MGVETEGTATTMMTGVGLQAPEAVELSWRMENGLIAGSDRPIVCTGNSGSEYHSSPSDLFWSWIGVQSDGFGAALLNCDH